MKKLALLLALAFSGVANATYIWETGPGGNGLTVHTYRYYWDGTSTFVEVEFEEPISLTGCTPSVYNATTNPYPKVAHWVASTTQQTHSEYALHTIMAASAEGRKVDIMWDNTRCNSTSGWMMLGVRVRPAP